MSNLIPYAIWTLAATIQLPFITTWDMNLVVFAWVLGIATFAFMNDFTR